MALRGRPKPGPALGRGQGPREPPALGQSPLGCALLPLGCLPGGASLGAPHLILVGQPSPQPGQQRYRNTVRNGDDFFPERREGNPKESRDDFLHQLQD